MRNVVAHYEKCGVSEGQGEQMTTAQLRNSTTQGVRKAVRLLHCFVETNQRTLAVGEMSAMTGWTKSSVSRLLSALREGGLVRQDPVTGRYAPGFELVA